MIVNKNVPKTIIGRFYYLIGFAKASCKYGLDILLSKNTAEKETDIALIVYDKRLFSSP